MRGTEGTGPVSLIHDNGGPPVSEHFPWLVKSRKLEQYRETNAQGPEIVLRTRAVRHFPFDANFTSISCLKLWPIKIYPLS